MKVEELARLLGKTRVQIEQMLSANDVIELNLNEKRQKCKDGIDELKIFV